MATSRRHRAAQRVLGLLAAERVNGIATTAIKAAHDALGMRPHAVFPTMLGRIGITEAPLPNGRILRLDSQGDEWSTKLVYWYGWDGFETAQARALFRLAPHTRTILDIGAHSGHYSLLAALANPAASVYAFEPLPVVFDRLVRNVDLNGTEGVIPQRTAASSRTGRASLLVPAHMSHPGIATLEPQHAAEFQKWDPTLETSDVAEIEVELITIDEWAAEKDVEDVDLVKIDVEQHEASVLDGMRRVLERDRPDLFCEVLDRDSGVRIRDALDGLGYSWHALTPSRVVPVPAGGDPSLSREHFLTARDTVVDVSAHS